MAGLDLDFEFVDAPPGVDVDQSYESLPHKPPPGPKPNSCNPDRVNPGWPTAANLIDAWLKKDWPELYGVPYAWFTGSSVWRFLYDLPLADGADLDVFIQQHTVSAPAPRYYQLNPEPLAKLKEALAKIGMVRPTESQKLKTSFGGEIYYTRKGRVDAWACGAEGTMAGFTEPQKYPAASHGHCKVAYSPFWKALVVQANPLATEQGEYELMERTWETRMVRARELQTKLEAK